MRLTGLIVTAILVCFVAPVAANPLNTWRISCSVDPGAITVNGKVRTFKTSNNRCPGGIFKQRAEISSDKVPPDTKGAYRFSSKVAMRTSSNQKFDIFQMHDGRLGCAPPLKVEVQSSGRLELISDYKTGPGESCVRGKLSRAASAGRLPRDGTEHKLDVVVDFDGQGGFYVAVWLDEVFQLDGTYSLPAGRGYFESEFFYFKHGVYSQRMFDYVLTSRDMDVRSVRLNR